MEVFRLVGSIFIDNDKANKAIDDTDKKGKGTEKTFGGMIKTAAKWGAAIVAGAAAAGAGMYAIANKSAETADRIDKLSQKIGLSRQGFQEWEFILSQSGTDIEKMQTGLKTLTQRMDEASKGTGAGSEAFKRLRLSAIDPLTGSLKSQEQMFEETVRALQQMPEGAEKARLATELFGKAGQELMPLLNGAAGSVDDLKMKAHELGLIIGDETIDAGVLFTDTMDQLKRASGAVFTNIGAALIPIFQQLAEWVIANMPAIQATIKAVFDGINIAISFVIEWIQKLKAIIQGWVSGTEFSLGVLADKFQWYFNQYQDVVKKVFDTIWTIIKTVLDLVVPFIQDALSTIFDFWEENGEMIMQAVQNLFGFIMATIDFVMPYIQKVIEVTWDIISNIIQTTIDVILGIIKFFAAMFTGDWDKMKQALLDIWTALWNGIKNFLETVWGLLSGTFGKLFGNIKDWFLGLREQALEWGKNMIQGFIDGMMSMINNIKDAASKVTNAIKGFLGFNSPAEEGEGRFIEQWGANMIEGFMDGMESMKPKLEMSLNTMVGAMKPSDLRSTETSSKEKATKTTQITNHFTFNSPEPITPRVAQRETEKTLRELGLEWGIEGA